MATFLVFALFSWDEPEYSLPLIQEEVAEPTVPPSSSEQHLQKSELQVLADKPFLYRPGGSRKS